MPPNFFSWRMCMCMCMCVCGGDGSEREVRVTGMMTQGPVGQ